MQTARTGHSYPAGMLYSLPEFMQRFGRDFMQMQRRFPVPDTLTAVFYPYPEDAVPMLAEQGILPLWPCSSSSHNRMASGGYLKQGLKQQGDALGVDKQWKSTHSIGPGFFPNSTSSRTFNTSSEGQDVFSTKGIIILRSQNVSLRSPA